MTREDYLKYKNYCQEIINKPRPMDDQPHARTGAFMWCEDWELIEILKYFFLGHDTYMAESPPRRLQNNMLWAKADIASKAEELKAVFKTADKIIEMLRKRRNEIASRI